ncbi:hypothetical protein H072_6486 [Dactylellina haptotyla CBS 200.50]|uniref:Uncharacterized protein n=1 Tax=Dactylellina haptotyla (strain CBS 200.50) TaxID=1284197 RepID=S8A9S0_DACHA|nr:hypothetical protein H072_6486 [Dactylellina haptotyla CBS 200.50]
MLEVAGRQAGILPRSISTRPSTERAESTTGPGGWSLWSIISPKKKFIVTPDERGSRRTKANIEEKGGLRQFLETRNATSLAKRMDPPKPKRKIYEAHMDITCQRINDTIAQDYDDLLDIIGSALPSDAIPNFDEWLEEAGGNEEVVEDRVWAHIKQCLECDCKPGDPNGDGQFELAPDPDSEECQDEIVAKVCQIVYGKKKYVRPWAWGLPAYIAGSANANPGPSGSQSGSRRRLVPGTKEPYYVEGQGSEERSYSDLVSGLGAIGGYGAWAARKIVGGRDNNHLKRTVEQDTIDNGSKDSQSGLLEGTHDDTD